MVLVVDIENSIIIIIKLESTPSEGLPLNYLVLMNGYQMNIWYQFIQIRLLAHYCDLLLVETKIILIWLITSTHQIN